MLLHIFVLYQVSSHISIKIYLYITKFFLEILLLYISLEILLKMLFKP